mmetsp:Transcript_40129/g.94452  ORF Transcript_40129/g.94452 Transcript_40129/m.94452 type:complete len:209 (-) Transcript_40129:3188-3814(-)
MLADIVHLWILLGLSSHLDGAIQQVHLVDEEVAEHTRAVADHINTRSAKLLQWDQLYSVHSTQVICHWLCSDQGQDLCQAFTVGLDVVCAPQSEGNRLWGLAILLHVLQKPVNYHQSGIHGSLGWDALGIQSVHVLASGQHIWVTNGVSTWAWLNELAVQRPHQAWELVVLDHFAEADLQVLEELVQLTIVAVGEALLGQRLLPWSAT